MRCHEQRFLRARHGKPGCRQVDVVIPDVQRLSAGYGQPDGLAVRGDTHGFPFAEIVAVHIPQTNVVVAPQRDFPTAHARVAARVAIERDRRRAAVGPQISLVSEGLVGYQIPAVSRGRQLPALRSGLVVAFEQADVLPAFRRVAAWREAEFLIADRHPERCVAQGYVGVGRPGGCPRCDSQRHQMQNDSGFHSRSLMRWQDLRTIETECHPIRKTGTSLGIRYCSMMGSFPFGRQGWRDAADSRS